MRRSAIMQTALSAGLLPAHPAPCVPTLCRPDARMSKLCPCRHGDTEGASNPSASRVQLDACLYICAPRSGATLMSMACDILGWYPLLGCRLSEPEPRRLLWSGRTDPRVGAWRPTKQWQSDVERRQTCYGHCWLAYGMHCTEARHVTIRETALQSRGGWRLDAYAYERGRDSLHCSVQYAWMST